VKEIATQAGVSEPTLYWHFGSKRGLFEAAVAEPLTAFIREFFAEWEQREPGSRPVMDEALDYLTGLYDVLHAERALILSVVADRSFSGESQLTTGALKQSFLELLRLHEERLRIELTERGYRPIDLHVWTRLFFSAIFTLAVHGDLIDVDGGAVRDAYIRGLAEMSMYGALPRPEA
jgi:AcrR family transcriptional regulator